MSIRKIKRCKHRDCRYRCSGATGNNCDYIFITGKSRSAQLPPDKRDPSVCPLYDPGDRENIPRTKILLPNSRRSRIDWDMARELYEGGATDRKISEALECPANTVAAWRRSNRLPAHKELPGPIYDWKLARELYEQGLLDEQIAERLGCSRGTVNSWRRREQLPPIWTQITTAGKNEQLMILYRQGLNDTEVAAASGFTKNTIFNWRHRHGLPANTGSGHRR